MFAQRITLSGMVAVGAGWSSISTEWRVEQPATVHPAGKCPISSSA
jgi:hypothetical protein